MADLPNSTAEITDRKSTPVLDPGNFRKKTVVVTGASSGIGRACALQMIQTGWHVFGTVRKIEDKERLQSADLTPVIMDVQDRSTIFAAAEQITSELAGRGLDGLVNVAGIGMVRPLEYATNEDLQEIFDINVFGQVAVTQAFLSLIRKRHGRIVNITSVGAHIAIPFGGLLNASKSAFGLLSDTLRLELHPFGIHVCTVEPGAIKTPAVDKTLGDIESVISNLPGPGAAQYGTMLENFARIAYAREMDGSPPDVVAKAVHHALTARRPRIRLTRWRKHAKLLGTLPRILSDWLLDAIKVQDCGASLGIRGRGADKAWVASEVIRRDLRFVVSKVKIVPSVRSIFQKTPTLAHPAQHDRSSFFPSLPYRVRRPQPTLAVRHLVPCD